MKKYLNLYGGMLDTAMIDKTLLENAYELELDAHSSLASSYLGEEYLDEE